MERAAEGEVVLRLLRGEDIREVSREVRVAPPELGRWRREFLDKKLREAGRPPTELALKTENETLKGRVNILKEKLLRAERDRKNAIVERQEMADRLKAVGISS